MTKCPLSIRMLFANQSVVFIFHALSCSSQGLSQAARPTTETTVAENEGLGDARRLEESERLLNRADRFGGEQASEEKVVQVLL